MCLSDDAHWANIQLKSITFELKIFFVRGKDHEQIFHNVLKRFASREHSTTYLDLAVIESDISHGLCRKITILFYFYPQSFLNIKLGP